MVDVDLETDLCTLVESSTTFEIVSAVVVVVTFLDPMKDSPSRFSYKIVVI